MSQTADMQPFEGELRLSQNLDYFRNGDEFYVHHNLFGYILKMSADVLEFLEYFRGASRTADEVMATFHGRFSDDMIGEFANVFAMQACLLAPDEREEERLLKAYPVRARFIVAHQPTEGERAGRVTFYALDHSTKSRIHIAELDRWASTLWQKIDGEKTVATLIEEMRTEPGSPTMGLEEKVFATLGMLTHCNLQILKMSAQPASTYRFRRHGTPPYLISSMPYERITAEMRGEEEGAGDPLMPGMRTEPIDESLLVRDLYENQMAFLFGQPHAALGDKSYGGRLADYCLAQGALPTDGPVRVLEVGGAGALAAAFLDHLRAEQPAIYERLQYTLVVPSDILADAAAPLLAAHGERARVVMADPLALAGSVEGPFDLVLTNEFVANLESLSVRKIDQAAPPDEDDEPEEEGPGDAGDGSEGEDYVNRPPATKRPVAARRSTFIGQGNAVQYVFRYALPLDDAPPEDFYLNTGAFKLLEVLSPLMADSSQLVLIEFGELYRYPVRTTEDAGEAYSIHFNHLMHVAKKLGFETDFGYALEALEFQRELPMLATTRSQFKAMRHLFAHLGHTLERRAWSQDEFEPYRESLGLGGDTLVEVSYEPLEDRVLGLVPHSLKLLRLTRGVASGVEV